MGSGYKGGAVSAALLAAVLASNIAAASPAPCKMRLTIELTPDAPEALDAGFPSSLLNNQLSYRLTLLGRQPGSVIVTELEGPGPEYRCRKAVEVMRSVEVLDRQPIETSSDSGDTEETFMIAAAPSMSQENPDESQPPLGGFASLSWAARHPTQAWRMFLPIQVDGDDLDARDATPEVPAGGG